MLSPQQIRAILDGIIDREGGLTDDPRDRGGLTNWGISQRAYPELNIAKLTRADAAAIYERDYLRRYKLHELKSAQNAEIVCDWIVNCGPIIIRTLQRVLKVTPDGQLGAQTLRAIDAADPKVLLNARLDYYVRLADHPFLLGWVNRLRKLGL